LLREKRKKNNFDHWIHERKDSAFVSNKSKAKDTIDPPTYDEPVRNIENLSTKGEGE
jgi:hypothetical protein